MMKNLNQYYVALFLLIGLSQSVFSQQNSEKIWVTFQNAQAVPVLVDGRLTSSNQNVQALMEEYSVIGVEQAIPSSKQEALRKVYEVECNCDAAEFSTAIEKNSIELLNPEIAPHRPATNLIFSFDRGCGNFWISLLKKLIALIFLSNWFCILTK